MRFILTILFFLSFGAGGFAHDAPQERRAYLKQRTYTKIQTKAVEFIHRFHSDDREKFLLDLNSPYRDRGFCYTLQHCPDDTAGITLKELTAEQHYTLHELLGELLSSSGYHKVTAILERENVLTDIENHAMRHPDDFHIIGSPSKPDWRPPAYRGSDRYYIAFFGHPEQGKEWGLRFEGHHLTLNFTFHKTKDGGLQVVATPLFLGVSPMTLFGADKEHNKAMKIDKRLGHMLLHKEAFSAKDVIAMLNKATDEKAYRDTVPSASLDGGTDMPHVRPKGYGVAYTTLPAPVKTIIRSVLDEYLDVTAPHLINRDLYYRALKTAKLARAGKKHGKYTESYFRLESDKFLLEILQSPFYSVTPKTVKHDHPDHKHEPIAAHIHSVFRDIGAPHDYDVLENHRSLSHTHR